MMRLSEGELAALFITHKALAQYHGTPFEQPLQAALNKLSESLPSQISMLWSELESAISFRSVDANLADIRIFHGVSSALQESKEIIFDYKKVEASNFEQRRVQPYHLASINHKWYLFAFDLRRQAIRRFVLSRMRKFKQTATTFARPTDFSLSDFLAGSFGVFSTEGKFTVVIWADSFAAQYIREKMWHASQHIHELPGGELRLTLELSSLKEVEPWILGWGDHARVLQPSQLRRQISHTIARMAALYTVPSAIAAEAVALHLPRRMESE
jgi:proteasome accessory factor B